jgi:hypothetical protein
MPKGGLISVEMRHGEAVRVAVDAEKEGLGLV